PREAPGAVRIGTKDSCEKDPERQEAARLTSHQEYMERPRIGHWRRECIGPSAVPNLYGVYILLLREVNMSGLYAVIPSRLQTLAHVRWRMGAARSALETAPSPNRRICILYRAVFRRGCSLPQSSAVWHSFCFLQTNNCKGCSAWS